MSETNAAATLALEIDTTKANEHIEQLESRLTRLGAMPIKTGDNVVTKLDRDAIETTQRIKTLEAEIANLSAKLKAGGEQAGKALSTGLASGGGSFKLTTILSDESIAKVKDRFSSLGIESAKALENGITNANWTKTNQVLNLLEQNTEKSLKRVQALVREANKTSTDFGPTTAQAKYGNTLLDPRLLDDVTARLKVLGVEAAKTRTAITEAGTRGANMRGVFDSAKNLADEYKGVGKQVFAAQELVSRFGEEQTKAFLGPKRYLVDLIGTLGDYRKRIAEANKEAVSLSEQAGKAYARLTDPKKIAGMNLAAGKVLYSGGDIGDFAPQAVAAARAAGSVDTLSKSLADLSVKQKSAAGAAHAHEEKIRGMPKHMWEAHSAARGLAGGLNALWLTYGATIPLMAGAALSGGFLSATKAGAEFAYQLTFVKALGGESAEAIAKIGATALDLSKTGLYGPVEMANGLRILSQAGLDASKSMAALPSVLDLATVGEMKMEDAALSLVGVMNAFSLPFSQLAHVGDMFAKAAALSQTSVQGMTEAMKYASVVGEQYNVSVEDTATALALLAKVNITGTSAGTAFRNMVKELYAPLPAAAAAIKKLGLETKDSAGNLRPFADIIYDLKGKLEQFDKASQVQILQRLFGERGAKEAIAMLALTREEWEKLKSSIENSDGFMGKVAAELEMTTKGRFKQALNTMQANMIEAFEASEGSVRSLADALKKAADSPEFKDGINAIVGGVAKLATGLVEALPLLIKFGEAWLVFKGISLAVAGITAAGAALSGLGTAVGGLAGVIGAAGLSLGTLQMGLASAGRAAAAAGSTGIAALAGSLGVLFSPAGLVVAGIAGLTALAVKMGAFDEKTPASVKAADDFSSALERQIAKLKLANDELEKNLELRRADTGEVKAVGEGQKRIGTIDTRIAEVQTLIDKIGEARQEIENSDEWWGRKLVKKAGLTGTSEADLRKELETLKAERVRAAKNIAEAEEQETRQTKLKQRAATYDYLDNFEKSREAKAGTRQASEVIVKDAKAAHVAKDAFAELAGAMQLANAQAAEKLRSAQLGEVADSKTVEAGHKIVKLIEEKLKLGKDLSAADVKNIELAYKAAEAADATAEALKRQNEMRRQAANFREGTLTVGQDAQKLLDAAEATRALGQATQQTAVQAAEFAIKQMAANQQISEGDKRARLAAAGFKDYATGYKTLVDETVLAGKGIQEAEAESLLVFADTEEKKLEIKRDAALKRIDLAFETARKEAEADLDAGPSNKGSLEELEARHQEARANIAREYQSKLRTVELKDWKGTVSTVEGEFKKGFMSMFDKGVNGWKSMTNTFKNTFKSTVLEYIYKAFAQPFALNVIASVGGALGFGGLANTAGQMGGRGGIGGIGNVLSMGSNIASNYGLLSQVATGSMSVSNALGTAYANAMGTGLDGLLASNGAYGTAGGSGALGGMSAIPVVGAIVAGMMASGSFYKQGYRWDTGNTGSTLLDPGFTINTKIGESLGLSPYMMAIITGSSLIQRILGKRGGPKYEGAQGFDLNTGSSFSDEKLPDGLRGYTKDDADATIGEIMKPAISGIKATVKGFGGRLAEDTQARFGFARDPKGTSGSWIGSDLFVGGKKVFSSNNNYGKDDEDFKKGVELETKRLTLASVAFAEGIDPLVQSIVRGTDIAHASLEQLDETMARATSVSGLAHTISNLRDGTTEIDRAFSDLLINLPESLTSVSSMVAPKLDDAMFELIPVETVAKVVKKAEDGALLFGDGFDDYSGAIADANTQMKEVWKAPELDAAAIRAGLKKGLAPVFQDIIGDFDVTTASTEDVNALNKKLGTANQMRTLFDNLGFGIDNITLKALDAAQNLDTFATNTQAYYDAITTPQQKLNVATQSLSEQFGKFGLKMPTTTEGFQQLVDGIDKSTPSGMRMVEMLMALFPAFQQVTQAGEQLRQQQLAALRSIRDSLDEINGVPAGQSAQRRFDNATGDLFGEAAKKGTTAWLDTWEEVLNLSDEQIQQLIAANPALEGLIKGAISAGIALKGAAKSSEEAAKAAKSYERFLLKSSGASPEQLGNFDKQVQRDNLNANYAAKSAALFAQKIEVAGKRIETAADAMSITQAQFEALPAAAQDAVLAFRDAAGQVEDEVNDIRDKMMGGSQGEQKGPIWFSAGEIKAIWAEQFGEIFGSAGDALDKSGLDFGEQTARMMALMQAELARQDARLITEGVDQFGNHPAELAMQVLSENLARLGADLSKYQEYEAQYKGHGEDLLNLDKWRDTQITMAHGNQEVIAAIMESYQHQFEEIINSATEGGDAAAEAWKDFRKSIVNSLADIGLSDMERKVKAINDAYSENLKKAAELANAAGIGPQRKVDAQNEVDRLALKQGNLTDTLDAKRAALLEAERLQAEQLAGGGLTSTNYAEIIARLRNEIASLNGEYATNAAALARAREKLAGMTEGSEEYAKTLEEIAQLQAAQLEKLRADFMAPISEELLTFGMSAYEKQIYEINKAYQKNIEAARDLTLSQEELAKIEELHNKQLKKAAEENLRGAYNDYAGYLNGIIDKFNGFADSIKDFRESLLLGDKSVSSLSDKTRIAFGQMEGLATKALGGDEKAYSSLTDAAGEFLGYAKSSSRTALDYARDFAITQAKLKEVEDGARGRATVAEQQLEQLKLQVGSLIDIKDAVKESGEDLARAVEDAIASLMGAISDPPEFDAAYTPPQNEQRAEQRAADLETSLLMDRLRAPESNNEVLIAEVKALREDLRAANAVIAQNTRDTKKMLQKFDVEGMPEVRT